MAAKPIDIAFPDPPEGLDPSRLSLDAVPEHVAVIMDGNGRWAKKRLMNRLKGHAAGIEAVRETIRSASDIGVRYLTIYSFSTENWKRSDEEVDGLMNLFAKTMLAEVDGLDEEGVRVMTIGDMSRLPDETREAFEEAEAQTADNDGMTLVVAVNYGSRDEIVHAVREWLEEADGSKEEVRSGDALAALAASFDEDALTSHLHTGGIPDPELIIRTSGEMRLSNFLLWQAAYSEFVCSDVLWPDFDRYEFLRCLLEYQARERRFGGTS